MFNISNAKVRLQDIEGWMLLTIVRLHRYDASVELLLDFGNSDITLKDLCGSARVILVAQNGYKARRNPIPDLFQSANTPPQANWTRNWMPTPTHGGLFRITMRLYAPDEDQYVNGQYVFPS